MRGLTAWSMPPPIPRRAPAGSVLAVMNHPQLNHQMEVEKGILAEEAGELLRSFFRQKRNQTGTLSEFD